MPNATPDDGRKPAAGPTPPSGEATRDGLRRILREILEGDGDPAVFSSCMAQLEAWSALHGPYIIAARLRVLMDAASGAKETPESRKAAYRLIAELLHKHVRDCLKAAAQGSTDIGPNLFSTYAAEYVDAGLSGLGIGATLSKVVPLIEGLVVLAIDRPQQRDYYCALADALGKHLRDQIKAIAINTTSVTRDLHGRAKRPTPWEAADYTSARYEQCRLFAEKLAQVPAAQIPERAALKGAVSAETANRYMAYLMGVLEAANFAQAALIAAYVQERAGSLLYQSAPERGRKSWAAAVNDYELQGDLELVVGLIGISSARFHRAAEVAKLLGDEDSATRLTFKARNVAASSPTPAPHKRTDSESAGDQPKS